MCITGTRTRCTHMHVVLHMRVCCEQSLSSFFYPLGLTPVDKRNWTCCDKFQFQVSFWKSLIPFLAWRYGRISSCPSLVFKCTQTYQKCNYIKMENARDFKVFTDYSYQKLSKSVCVSCSWRVPKSARFLKRNTCRNLLHCHSRICFIFAPKWLAL